MSEVLTVARGPAKAAGRVRSPSLTPSPSSPTGRGAWFRARRFPVRIRGGALKEHWPSGYGSALLRRTSGNRCEGSSPSCSARGWLADLVRRPAGKPVTARAVGRFESCAIRSLKEGQAECRTTAAVSKTAEPSDGPCGSEPHSFRSGCAIRLATEPALKPGEPVRALQVRLLPHPLKGNYPTGEGDRLIRGYCQVRLLGCLPCRSRPTGRVPVF